MLLRSQPTLNPALKGPGQPVDFDLLRFKPGALDGYIDSGGPPCATPQYRSAVDFLKKFLGEMLPPELDHLAKVSAHYAALSLRHDYESDPVARVYPLFLLAAWIWDDVVDTNKHVSDLNRLIDEGWQQIACASSSTFQMEALRSSPDLAPGNRPDGDLTEHVQCSADLMARANRLLSSWAHGFSPPIESEVIRFFHSFQKKVSLTHFANVDREHFINTRQVCVGMQPCYEMSFAFKARALGVSPHLLHAYTEQALTKAAGRVATLHCAAVNDLFSIHKDRVKEDTANFPSQLAPTSDLAGYYAGAQLTIEYIRSTFDEFVATCADLPDHPCKELVVQTWQHMMEGNLVFHLRVPRYAEGVALVRTLLDGSLSVQERQRQFRTSFPPSPAHTEAERT